MGQKTIAVDVDDVLSLTAEAFIAHTNKLFGHQLTVADYQDDWGKMWGVPLDQAMRRAAQVSKEHHYLKECLAIEHALPVLQRLKKDYRLVVVTARRLVTKQTTEDWLAKQYPDVFSDIIYAGIWDSTDNITERVHRSKANICQELGADYLIDDQLKHCIGAADCGITSLLFGGYPWAQTTNELPNNLIKVDNWKQVEEYFYV
jgi:5'(3')-deoxyribonucleotidase